MDYSVELTARIRADGGSWQCIDCKACVLCQDSGDPVSWILMFKITTTNGYDFPSNDLLLILSLQWYWIFTFLTKAKY